MESISDGIDILLVIKKENRLSFTFSKKNKGPFRQIYGKISLDVNNKM